MNSDIKIMLELQEYWDNIRSSKSAIEKALESTRAAEKEIAEHTRKLNSIGNSVMELKNSVKRQELDLADMGNRIKKLEDRKMMIKTEKELHAREKEIDVIRFDIGSLEEKTLTMIDELDGVEKKYSQLEQDVRQKEIRLNDARLKFAQETSRHEEIVARNEEKFNSLIGRLSAGYKSKFLKFLNSRDGTAIARVEDEICGFCNRKIPPYLAIEASKDDRVATCSNCGKYIYK
ncbi:MAG: hypothetical protein A2176_11640 [Spirochaetes bacterium RBG_13_51_14]|nr:MAG: hypothetical protein A2176_11640 [Spirochaetes bacterium RBG_13_51_14]